MCWDQYQTLATVNLLPLGDNNCAHVAVGVLGTLQLPT